MVQSVGPMWPGGFETITTMKDGQRYEILYLPDLHNDELQNEGKPPVYYWLPNAVRIARKGDIGDYKFHLINFVGVLSEDTTVGVAGTKEVAGGVLSVTVTAAPPLDVLAQSQALIKDRLRTDSRRYWQWRGSANPQFAPVPISDSRTHMSNLSPGLDGTVPSAQPAPVPVPSPGGGAGAPPGRAVALSRRLVPRLVPDSTPVRAGRDVAPGGLDAWYMRIEGDGPGSLNPAGESAFTALCGSYPTAILWSGFHGAYSPVTVAQTLNLKLWSETLRIKITGNWDRVFSHFSAAAQGRAWWWSADIKTEFNNLRINGGITVEVEIDGTNPGADKMKEEVDKRIDLIVNKFTEAAKARIFDPAPPDVKPAESSGGGGGILSSLFGGFGGGFALKYRRDETKLELHYEETRQERFNLPTTISSSLEGFFDEIKRDPDAEQKYFTNLILDDWNRKITHTVKPVVNWPDAGRQWVGEPVAFVSCQIGYPAVTGDIQWAAKVFQSTDSKSDTWQPALSKKKATDVVNPPAGWTPDISFVKRSIHFTEPPSDSDNPYVRCAVEKNVVELDPEPNGTATKDLNIEVRADSAGKLAVGPIGLGALLEGSAQTVEVEFQAYGKTDQGQERPVVRFAFNAADQDKERYWSIFTGQLDYLPAYRYRVHVVVKGSLFTHGMEWWSEWADTSGNGPLMVVVPTQEEAAQIRRFVPSNRPRAVELPPGAGPAPSTRPAVSAVGPSHAAVPAVAGRPPGRAEVTSRDVQGYLVGTPTKSAAKPVTTKAAPAKAAGKPVDRSEPPAHEDELVLVSGWSTQPRGDD
jgi:hypothetical protein